MALFMLMAAGMPIGFALLVVGFIGYVFFAGWAGAFAILSLTPYTTASNYTFITVPLFVLMGEVCFRAGFTEDLFKVAYAWLGRLPGGLATAVIGASALFGAICGSSTAGAASMSVVSLTEMKRYDYDRAFAAATVAAGGTLSILIPPSIALVVYGILVEKSIVRLFAAGILPGIVLVIVLGMAAVVMVKFNPRLAPMRQEQQLSWRERFASLGGIWTVACLFILVMGGMFTGLFTPTESAAVGAFGAFLIAAAKRRLTRKLVTDTLSDSARLTCIIFAIIAGAKVFNVLMGLTKLPEMLSIFLESMGLSPLTYMLAIVALYFVLGCIMDTLGMVLLTVPVLYPATVAMGFDPIWFGIVIVLMMELGLLTPPIGLNVYVVQSIARDVSSERIFRASIPYWFSILAVVFILIWLPDIALIVPRLIYGR